MKINPTGHILKWKINETHDMLYWNLGPIQSLW